MDPYHLYSLDPEGIEIGRGAVVNTKHLSESCMHISKSYISGNRMLLQHFTISEHITQVLVHEVRDITYDSNYKLHQLHLSPLHLFP